MSNSCNISSLKTLSCDLLNGALKEIRSHRENTSPTNEEYFLTAEYLLQEAMEYVDGSWEMIISGKSNASIALSRWVLEASLNLLWTVVDRDKTEERLKVLVGEALRCDACLLEGLAELWTDKSRLFESKAKEARRIRKSLGVEKPESLDGRLEEIRQTDKTNWPELYALYRICCAAAHPNLKVWERFCSVASSTSSKDPIDKQPIACWMAAASTLYLVTHAYCLTELGNIDVLKHWWEKQVVPLLI
ncbi:MAG: hypothetical protein ACYS74_07120 [Planctomycetota bacterium]|jgi:hypothetical protein